MPPPVLVFVPGAFQTPQVFSPLCKHLSLLGQTCLCVSLPSTGADPPHPDRTQDVLAVQNVIAEAVGRTNKNVVVVAHAEGGTVAIEAVKGLHATGRGREVWGLVFLAGVVLPAGKALTDFQEDLFPDGQQPYFEVKASISFQTLGRSQSLATIVVERRTRIRHPRPCGESSVRRPATGSGCRVDLSAPNSVIRVRSASCSPQYK